MLKRVFKWLGVGLLLVLIAIAGVVLRAQSQVTKKSEMLLSDPPLALSVELKPEWIQEGERIARMKSCQSCHGEDMAGQIFIQDPAAGTYAGANLTKGIGGIGATYTDQDWVRAIRFGRNPQKRYLKFMPADEFASLTDEDLGKLIVYLKSLPAVDRSNTPIQIGPLTKILYSFGKMPLLFPGENVDLGATALTTMKADESVEYGRYVAAGCVGCHRTNFAGGAIPGVPPHWPMASNLTPKGNLSGWEFEDFKKTVTTGVTPDGKKLQAEFMPWPSFAAMNETELKALFGFLKSLPETETN